MNASVMHNIDEAVRRFGWAAIGVMPTVDDPDPCMPFTYTVGFYGHDEHPELIVVGLAPEQSHAILWGLFERVRNGERFEAGQRDSDVLQGYDVVFQAMGATGRPLNAAREYYGREELPALQVVWPDANGLFPFEDGFDEDFIGRQVIKKEDL